ncbi:MAG: SCO family protein [Legionellaceae bacterium]|nr:SCO family protein [Legionellaceae bacterium]
MLQSKNRIVYTVAVLLAIVACVLGLYVAQQMHHTKQPIDKSLFHGTLLDTPREVKAFELTGTDHQPFNNNSLNHQWTMLFFGFTHCGSMCPTTMAELGKTYRLLEQKGAQILPHVVMISLDPERDDLERLDHYVHAFDKHFYGARGEDQSIHAMTRDMGIAYAKITRSGSNDSSQEDDIEHTGAVMLFNPQGHLVAFFTNPHHAEDIASDFLLLIKGNTTT